MMRGKRWSSAAAIAVALLFVACEAKSPTAPSQGGGPGTPPPTGASIGVTVSNANPLVNSTATITATVSGGSAPDGTAVEFVTDLGTFVDTAEALTIRTTTGGNAAATLTSSQIGTATVTIRVNNVSATASVTFKDQPSQPGEPVPIIASFSPIQGKPAGGELVTINGSNFFAPVRVLFGDLEATVASVTDTQIRAVAPQIQMTLDEQARDVTVVVVTEAGTQGEQSTTSTSTYRYELEILTPKVLDVSPSSGPNEGNTRITIFGEAFQAPLRVFFGTGGSGGGSLTNQVEVTVLQVTYNQVIAMTPPALGLGTELANSQVALRVLNVQSGKDVVVSNAFRYGPKMQITSMGPTEGPASGGTRVTFNGWGFDDPVAVVIGGVAAQTVRVSGTEIVAVTSAISVTSCDDVTGESSVTNIEDGTTAAGVAFIYRVPKPAIISVSPSEVIEGRTVQVTVANPGTGTPRFEIGAVTRLPTAIVDVGGGAIKYTITAPTTLEFVEEACGVNGMQFVPQQADVKFINVTTTCEDTLPGALTIDPADSECHQTPEAKATPEALSFGPVLTGTTADLSVTISNIGGATLTISAAASDTAVFTRTSGTVPASVAPGSSTSFGIRFAPLLEGSYSGTITFTTNAGDVTVNVSGDGAVP